MDGVHDLGGMQGFGPVVADGAAPPFREPWEGRTHGMLLGVGLSRGIRGFRYWIESMGNEEYLTGSYYEHWLHAVEQILLRTGDLAEGELDAAVAAGRVPMERVDQPEVAALVPVLLHRSPAPARSERPAGRYAPGDRVRVARRVTSEHNRVPRYVRGATGVVESVAGDEPLEEGIDHGPPQPVYSVSFAADDLWADGADADVDVVLDLFETYLEPA